MKLAYTFLLALSVGLLFQSCGSDNYEITTETDLIDEPVLIEYDNPLTFATTRTTDYLLEGLAYQTKNGEDNSLFTIASEAVTVECPGSATSYDGGGIFFQFQFIQTPEGVFTFSGNLTAEFDGKVKTAFYTGVPDCEEIKPMETIYTITNNRISGTITGEFFYFADVFVEPFENCDNFISTGELTVSFDLPLTVCN